MIDIDIVNKSYEDKTILKNINITIKDKEFISIIGPSGCGKTTFLNILAKIDEEFAGEIKHNISNLSFVFQDDRLLPWLSIKQNLLLVSKSKNLDEIKELLRLVKLETILDKYPHNLSGGMKRRVALIRAFINSPKLILLDEPFISLDYPTALELKKEFLTLCKKFNPIVVLVTHDLSEAINLSNRILFFKKEPAKVIIEYNNPNNQSFDMKKIDDIKNKILQEYPSILKGEI
ncbi:MAG: ABC transporter ATP-binding protein [Arcobacter sp.]|uniref:ABC transporter ATP-binding protein n=1 Tax=Arcobacter sp. TaxID=1872629 RepID=UPI003B00824C